MRKPLKIESCPLHSHSRSFAAAIGATVQFTEVHNS